MRLSIRHLATVGDDHGPDDELINVGIGPHGAIVELRGNVTRVAPFGREAQLTSAITWDSSGSRRIALEQTRLFWYVRVQPLATGGLVVMDSRAQPGGDQNAVVFGPDGGVADQFEVGDGIAEFLVDDSDGLWVSYFDEGVFSGHPLPAHGLCLFDTTGNLIWSNNLAQIYDCYALNVAGKTAWAYYYDAFDVMRVEADDVHLWHTDAIGSGTAGAKAHGSRALLVDDERVLLLGSYGAAYAATRWSLGSDQLEAAQRVELDLPDELRDGHVVTSVVCRGDRVYFVDGNKVYSGSMTEMS